MGKDTYHGGPESDDQKLQKLLNYAGFIMETPSILVYTFWFMFHHDCHMGGLKGRLEHDRCPHLTPGMRKALDDWLEKHHGA